ncbi:alkaline phosphatase family protein [Myxococcota bacterium]|nr:alkaline phosphatase family protein [Myxococcota bacterium]
MSEKSFYPRLFISSSRTPSWRSPLPVDGRLREPTSDRMSVGALLRQWRSLLKERLRAMRPLIRPGLRLVVCGGLLWVWGAGQEGSQVPQKVRTSQRHALPAVPFSPLLSFSRDATSYTPKQKDAHRAPAERSVAPHRLPKPSHQIETPKRPSIGDVKQKLALSNAQVRRVFLISWDGAKSSVLRVLMEKGQLPALKALWQSGVGTLAARTIIPSLTLPSHTSMLTGQPFERHKIHWNRYIAKNGVVRYPTILDIASDAGVASGFFVSKKKFFHLVRQPGRYVVHHRNHFAPKRMDALLAHLQRAPLRLVFFHLRDPDLAGHWFGWGNEQHVPPIPPSAQYQQALMRSDKALGRLMQFLKANRQWKESAVIVTSDHGGHDRTHGSAHHEDRLIPWIMGGSSEIRRRCVLQEPLDTYDTAATVLWLLGLPRPKEMVGQVRLRCR